MHIGTITPDRHAEFLELVDAEIRPDHAETHAWDDFPLILDPRNSDWTLAATAPDGTLAGGLACLVREYSTSCGRMPIAGVGSVVTRPEFRGQGVSRALQDALLEKLRGKNVPLAVLWTDQPEIYAGRGFAAAGWDWHVDFSGAGLGVEPPPGFTLRSFRHADGPAVQALYDRHSLRTIRAEGDGPRLYTMPGTTGWVAVGDDDCPAAAVFCGKGADFPSYITEWSGPVGLVLPLLGQVREAGLATQLLAPPGADQLLAPLVAVGAEPTCQPGGFWAVLQPEALGRYLQAAGAGAPRAMSDPAAVLGDVGPDGQPRKGPVTVAVWGFDSV